MEKNDNPETLAAFASKASKIKQLQDAFFFVLYVMRSKTEPPRPEYVSTALDLLSDWVHVAGYIFGSVAYQFGPLTMAYGQIPVFLQFRTPYRPGYFAPDFLIVFGVFTFLSAAIVVITGVCMLAFSRRDFKQLWAIKILNLLVSVMLKFFTVSSISVLLTPYFCDPSTGALLDFPHVQCFTDPLWLAPGIIGIVSTVFLLPYLLGTILGPVTLHYSRNELISASVPSFNVYATILTFIFIFEGEALYALHSPIIMASIFLVSLVFIEYHLLSVLPFHHSATTRAQSGLLASLIWLAFCGLISMVSEHASPGQNRAIDYVLVIGFPFSGYVGYRLAKSRIETFRRLSVLVQAELDTAQLSFDRPAGGRGSTVMQSRGNLSDAGTNGGLGRGGCPVVRSTAPLAGINGGGPSGFRNESLHERALDNPTLRSMLQSVSTVEIIGRFLLRRKAWRVVEAWYRAALAVHVNNVWLHMLYCNFVDTMNAERAANHDDSYSTIPTDATTWEAIPNLSPSLSARFFLFCRDMDREQKSATKNVISGTDRLDLLQYVEFQRSYTEAKRYHAKCVASIQQFWILFLSRRVQFQAFEAAVRLIITNTRRADEFYRQLLSRYPKATHILKAYSNFARLVLNDSELADTYANLAESARLRDEEQARNFGGADGQDSAGLIAGGGFAQYNRTAVVVVNQAGTIQEVNGGSLRLFGYNHRNELVERKVNTLIPFPWRMFHDDYMDRYKASGVRKLIGAKRMLYGLHSKGHCFPIEITVTEMKAQQHLFAGIISAVPERDNRAVVMINRDGVIQMVNRFATTLFGYKPSEFVGENVSLLMPREHASQHDGYIQRFLETGEAHVVDTPGRFFTAKLKSGKTIPVAIRLEEVMINNEIFFTSSITDLRQLVAEVSIDAGTGLMKTVNDDFVALFGYDRDDAVGKKVNMLMPEPYRSLHDGFLERYRRLRTGPITRSSTGRKLPAVHRDGTVFSMVLRVKQAGNGFGAGEASSVLQATITLAPETDSNSETSEDLRILVSMSGTILKAGTSIAHVLGFQNSKDLVNSAFTSIVPAVPESCGCSSITQFLERITSNPPTLQHYTLMVARDRTVIPIAVSGAEIDDGVLLQCIELMPKEGLLMMDDNGMLTQANADASAIFGYPAESIHGQFLAEFIPDLNVSSFSGETVRLSVTATHRGGNAVPIILELVRRLVDGIDSFLVRITHAPVAGTKQAAEVLREHQTTTTSTMDRRNASTTQLISPIGGGGSPSTLTASPSGTGDSHGSPSGFGNGGTLGNMANGGLRADPHMDDESEGDELLPLPTSPPNQQASPPSPSPPNRRESILRAILSPPGNPNVAATSSGPLGSFAAIATGVAVKTRFMLSPTPESGAEGSGEAIAFGNGPTDVAAMTASQHAIRPTEAGPSPTTSSAQINRRAMSKEGGDFRGSSIKFQGSQIVRVPPNPGPAKPTAGGPPEPTRQLSVSTSLSGGAGSGGGGGGGYDSASTTTGSDAESTASGADRNSKLILAWKNARKNPLHDSLQKRLWVSLVLLLSASIAVTVVFHAQAMDDYDQVRTTILHPHLATDLFRYAETVYYCNMVNPNSVLCKENIAAHLTSTSRSLSFYNAQLRNLIKPGSPDQVDVKTNIEMSIFVSEDPTVATKVVIPSIWQVINRVTASGLALANATRADPSTNRDWLFLVNNKDTVLQNVVFMADRLDDVVETHTIAQNMYIIVTSAAYIGIAILVLVAVLWPELHRLNLERSKALLLISRMPRPVISYLAYQVYEVDDNDGAQERENDNDSDENDMMRRASSFADTQGDAIGAMLSRSPSFGNAGSPGAGPGGSGGERSMMGAKLDNFLNTATTSSEKRSSGSKASLNTSAPASRADYWVYLVFGSIYLLVIVPTIIIVVLKLSTDNVRSNIRPITAYALEIARPGSKWTTRTERISEVLGEFRERFEEISHFISLYPHPDAYISLMQQPFTVNPNVNSPMAANMTTTKGFQYMIEDRIQEVLILAQASPPSPTAGGKLTPRAQEALESFLQSSEAMYLGMESLAFLHLEDFENLTKAEHTLNLNVHIMVNFLICGVVYALIQVQGRMREDIKQNCLLLLMVPAGVINRQKPIKQYLNSICSQIRRQLGSTVPGKDFSGNARPTG
ncbi:hypothetical protein H9P43_004478 [Blastocladiella emersonii ATCC 22665]|nr:hypothetical protein H9P43_004478 [Blastocladiella emersonii ATCC 22665]